MFLHNLDSADLVRMPHFGDFADQVVIRIDKIHEEVILRQLRHPIMKVMIDRPLRPVVLSEIFRRGDQPGDFFVSRALDNEFGDFQLHRFAELDQVEIGRVAENLANRKTDRFGRKRFLR